MSRLHFTLPASKENRYRLAADTELVVDCLAGQTAAWDALIARYAALIYATGLRMGLSQADAEDVFQDVCVILLNHLEDLRDSARLSGWLIATTRREAWRLQRRKGVALASELGEGEWEMEGAEGVHAPQTEHATGNPEANFLALEAQQTMREALMRLPDRCRLLLTRLYVDDPPANYTDLAVELSMPVGSLGPTRARCLQNLRKLLAEQGY